MATSYPCKKATLVPLRHGEMSDPCLFGKSFHTDTVSLVPTSHPMSASENSNKIY